MPIHPLPRVQNDPAPKLSGDLDTNGHALKSSGVAVFVPNAGLLNDAAGLSSVDAFDRFLLDAAQAGGVNWQDKQLVNNVGDTVLDWHGSVIVADCSGLTGTLNIACLPTAIWPTSARWQHIEDTFTAGSAPRSDNAGNCLGKPRTLQDPPAIGDTFNSPDIPLAAGNYTFHVNGDTGDDQGTIQWYRNNVLISGSTQDWYAASPGQATKSFSFTVPTSGVQVFKAVVSGLNASNSDPFPYIILSKIWISKA